MIWLSVKEISKLLGYEESIIRKKAKLKEFKYRYISSSTDQGGRKMEILLESLPEQAQKAYHNKNEEFQYISNQEYSYTTAQR